jgi:hypothetical protein
MLIANLAPCPTPGQRLLQRRGPVGAKSLWHTRVRNALQPSQPGSTNDARNSRSRTFHAGSRRTHNPSAVGSSPTCPTGVSAGQRPATGPTEPSRAGAPGSVFVPHREWGVWNPPVVSLTETASIPVRAGQTPDTPASSRPEPFTGRDLVAHSWHSPSGIRRGHNDRGESRRS